MFGLSVANMGGTVCSRECDATTDCPSDVEPGTDAYPTCVTVPYELDTSYCVLNCRRHWDASFGVDTICGDGAVCSSSTFTDGDPPHGYYSGLCTYGEEVDDFSWWTGENNDDCETPNRCSSLLSSMLKFGP